MKTEEGITVVDKRRIAIDHFKNAEGYLSKGELDKAEAEVKTAISLDPNHPVPHLLLGDILFEREVYEKALLEYERASELDTTKGIPYAKMGEVYVRLGKYHQAHDALRTAVRLDPDIPGLHRVLGDLYKRMGLKHEAEYEYRTAETLAKSGTVDRSKSRTVRSNTKREGSSGISDPQVGKIVRLGDEFLRDGNYSLAIEQYKIAARLEPNSVIVHQKLGDAYVRKGLLDKAVVQYNRVGELWPDSPLSYLGLGIVHARMYDIEKAIYFFKKGLALKPKFAPLHFELAMVYHKADRLADAIDELEQTVELDSVNPQPKEILAKVRKEREAEEGYVKLESRYFILKYDPKQDRHFIEDVQKSINEAYQALRKDLSYQPDRKIIVKIYPDLREFHLAATTPQWFRGGVAATKDYKILLATPKRERNIEKLPEVIKHEMTHAFTNLMTYNNLPGWAQEGIAVYEASQWDLKKKESLVVAIHNEELYGLEELEKPFTRFKDPRRINLAYAQSYTAIKFILERYGREKLLATFDQFARGKNFAETARDVLGMTLVEFEQEWVDWIKKTYS
jgi:tetratricopeptide (TPR) repeat protein